MWKNFITAGFKMIFGRWLARKPKDGRHPTTADEAITDSAIENLGTIEEKKSERIFLMYWYH